MKTSRLSVAIMFFVAFSSCIEKQTGVVWNYPATESGNIYGDGYFKTAIDVVKVEMKENETVLHLNIQNRPENKFRFAKDSYLATDSLHYMAVSADSIELGKWTHTEKDGQIDIALHFEPLPLDTKTFDFIEGNGKGAFFIKGIKPVEERWKQLFPSYWRNGKTGDWEIALLDSFAIYQCKFWNYKSCNVNKETDEAEIVMTNDENQLTVRVGKDRNGRRTMRIGRQKKTYSMITGRFLPDYPHMDTRTDFAFDDYNVDTVTVIGWLKDMSDKDKKNKEFSFSGPDIYSPSKGIKFIADIDGQGRFSARIPVYGSTEFFCDWSRCYIRTMLEPGKTYFLLYDFKEGRRFFMGDDVRLQNELLKYPLDWNSISFIDYPSRDFDSYIVSADSLIKAQNAYIDSLCGLHPSLSARFSIYRKDNTLWQQARDIGQGRFMTKKFMLPENVIQYAYNTFWTKLKDPLTLHRETRSFVTDFMGCMTPGISWSPDEEYFSKIAADDEELELLRQWASFFKEEVTSQIGGAIFQDEYQKLMEAFLANHTDIAGKVFEIYGRPDAKELADLMSWLYIINNRAHILDSLGVPPGIKDIELCRLEIDHFESNHSSVAPAIIDTLRSLIVNKSLFAEIEKMNDYYIALENKEFDKLVLKSSDNLDSITDGEALLREILGPFKGKLVLLDVWGTWCGPCREALSHSSEEFECLKPYDVEFLYLANNSPKESWENVIKEYNVTGNNVTHYNLPEEQQSAIERYLKINSYPTYKLFDRDGNLFDMEVDARSLSSLESLIKRLSPQ